MGYQNCFFYVLVFSPHFHYTNCVFGNLQAYSGDSGARKSSASASAAQHVDNSSLQAATVMQDSGINHSGAAESNTRPKRFTKKPSYLADYKC